MPLAVAYFGTYDPGYPRNRVLIEGLRAAGAKVSEYDAPLPAELTAARLASVAGAGELARELARAHLRLVRMHPDWVAADVVLVGYPGHLVVPFAWTLARIRRAHLVFDPLVSLHDTFVGDRRLVGGAGAAARAASAADRVAFALADLVLADTAAHARFYSGAFAVPERRLAVVPVGALPLVGATGRARDLGAQEPLVVFQYGKWSPLHGAGVVVGAAELLRDEPFRFVLAGEGQLSAELRSRIGGAGLENVEWAGLLAGDELRARTLAADVCIGVLGATEKASRVVPNKVYDALAAGRPIVTADSPAAREALVDGESAVLVPAGSAEALASALRRLRDRGERLRLGENALALYRERFTPEAIGRVLLTRLERLVDGSGTASAASEDHR
jgi:glycosyltransferase involved in cell wall biosynthesis